MKTVIKITIIFLLLLWLFYDIDWYLFFTSLQHLNIIGIILTFLTVFFSDIIISYRWYYLGLFRYSFLTSLEANMLAFFLNIFAPAKLGDLSKIYYLHKKESAKIKDVTAMFLIERFFDVIILGFLILFSTLFIYPEPKAYILVIFIALITLIFFYLLLQPKRFYRLLQIIPWRKLRLSLYQIYKSLQSFMNIKKIVILTLLSLAVWGGYYLNNFVFFTLATDFHLTFSQIFIASTLAFAVSAIPITPGGIGTFQAAFVLVLGWYGIPKESALSASIVLQFLYILPATLYSIYLFMTKEFL
ncbi:glycosyltransferase 2 family protein [Nitratiruptor sp. YY08-26]|uniref:lysylphosphatidylglycerol synthase transmembrane domain-containing protein n=1 Tax=unclassified Nitratiruptor TaxID=2624044 RepID=UPI0019157EF8|nr:MULTISPECIES: lysylphosphatidylglycerol synthase transmembrane domain-containing protein [unclassified Nitratiruptor]BCD62626.1 glycosyltransferase 2 family protein [Nitratiruptor sp. YY08-13]BCD66562.1 glycosyltransferase 2 family protein [Nitratiruptor sp. YY08-26]